jgi:hypothetical protein
LAIGLANEPMAFFLLSYDRCESDMREKNIPLVRHLLRRFLCDGYEFQSKPEILWAATIILAGGAESKAALPS